MNNREDWHNHSSYRQQFMCSLPGVAPSFGVPSNNWLHVPPQTMPWGLPSETHPSVMRFTAGEFSNNSLLNVKRKYETSVETPPTKVLVTEEKMAAHMKGLHISDIDESPESLPEVTYKEEPMETERLPRLVLSDEIKNLKTESIIPESILKKLEKPEMALVLWQPPAADLGSKLRELKKLSLCKNKKGEKEKKEADDKEMDITAETKNMFRPIDPVPMPAMSKQYYQPVPQFHGYSPFS